MKKQLDITSIYMQNATPGVGHILYDKGYILQSHEEEIKMSLWPHNHLGGDIRLNSERSGTYKAKSADFEWRGKLWELKTIKSERAIDSALRKGISQIFENPGGVILDFGNNPVKLKSIELAVKSRIESSCRFQIDIIIICKGELQMILRYK